MIFMKPGPLLTLDSARKVANPRWRVRPARPFYP
jgi:hypothetical protein